MICNRADSFARRPLIAAAVSVEAAAYVAGGLTQSVSTPNVISGVSHRLGMRPFTNSKRKTNRFPV